MTYKSYLPEVRTEIEGGFKRNVKAATLILHKAVLQKLRGGGRTGEQYRIPGGARTYTASAPGEPPAVRTGRHLSMWDFTFSKDGTVGRVGNTLKYALYLERGTSKMAPRPTLKPGLTENESKISRALRRPF